MFKVLVLLYSVVVFSSAFADDMDQELHNAVRNSNMDMLKYFLENKKSSINKKDDFGYTAIHLATRKNDLDSVRYILKFKPDLDTQDKFGDTPLIDGARNNNMDIVKLLVCAGADKSTKNNDGKTAMDFISANKQYETALFMQKPKCNEDNEKEKKDLVEKLRKLK